MKHWSLYISHTLMALLIIALASCSDTDYLGAPSEGDATEVYVSVMLNVNGGSTDTRTLATVVVADIVHEYERVADELLAGICQDTEAALRHLCHLDIQIRGVVETSLRDEIHIADATLRVAVEPTADDVLRNIVLGEERGYSLLVGLVFGRRNNLNREVVVVEFVGNRNVEEYIFDFAGKLRLVVADEQRIE